MYLLMQQGHDYVKEQLPLKQGLKCPRCAKYDWVI